MTSSLLADRRGSSTLLIAAALPALLWAAALAVDVGSVELDARRLQGVADAAALAAATDPDRAQLLAEAAVAASGLDRPVRVEATAGTYAADPRLAAPARFRAAKVAPDAVRVVVTAASPTFFAALLGKESVTVRRAALAAREKLAAFSVGGRLAALDGGVLNAALSALAGSRVSLGVVDYQALANADLDVGRMADLLRARLGMDGASYAVLLGRRVPVGQLLSVMAGVTDGAARAALDALSAQAGPGGESLALGDLVDLGPYAPQAGGAAGLVRVNALAAVSQILRGGAAGRAVTFDAGVPGAASTRVTLVLGAAQAQSPWVAVTGTGKPVVRTAQLRLYAEAQLVPAPLPGLPAALALRVPLYVESSRAEARLSAIACPAPDRRSVTLDARPGPVTAALADADAGGLADFSRPVALADARVLTAPLTTVDARADLDSGGAESWQPVAFDDAAIRSGEPRTVSGSRPLTGLAQSLARGARVTVRVAGLPVPAASLTAAVAGQIAAVAPALDALLDAATGAVGVHLGQADVRVTGVRCGVAALVG